jgi:hypothetical protein
MNRLSGALVGGFAGALATNVLHQALRPAPDAPRVDLLGMQATAKALRAIGVAPPIGRRLYGTTFAGDVLSNTAYFALAGFAPRRARSAGLVLGALAGIGAVALPPRLGLDEKPTARTATTRALTIAYYGLGGIVAGIVIRRLR